MFRQRFPVIGKGLLDNRHELLMALLAPVIDQRRVFFDRRRQIVQVHQFGKFVFEHTVLTRLRESVLKAITGFIAPDRWDQFFDINARIPNIQAVHFAEFRHVFAIRAHAGEATSREQSSLKPLSRQARTKLVARRFTSHSQGAGSVSSRSLMSKITRRSGVAKRRS